jgi:GNAT superfamily N-acetyltransferase
MSLRDLFAPQLDAEGFVVLPTDSEGFILDEGLLSWESQASQYPALGSPGPGYLGRVATEFYTVDCLLWRDNKGIVVGILNHYPADFAPWERAHNVNIWVRPDHQRQGIGHALVTEALRRWPQIDLTKQRFTRSGKALADTFTTCSHCGATLDAVIVAAVMLSLCPNCGDGFEHSTIEEQS